MIQQVQNSYQFHGLPDDDANRHIDKFLEVTQHMKQNEVFDDALRLSLFLYSLMHHATAWYDHLSRNSIHTFDDMMRKFLSNYFHPSMVTQLRNEITKFRQELNESLFEAWESYMLSIDRGYTQEAAYATTGNYNSRGNSYQPQEVLQFKKSNHPSSGSTTPVSDSSLSLTPFKTSNSLLEEFADELDLLDPFPSGKEDNNFDFEADLLCITPTEDS
nr:reverse transcriptase domain-containing protein [Tanacetum cinerariifolium]